MSEKYVVSEDVAELTIIGMEEEFGAVGDPSSRAVLFDAVQRGLVDFDEDEAKVTYRLQKPIDREDGEKLTALSFTEPDVEQIEKINRGIKVTTDRNGNTTMDGSVQTQQVKRIVSVVAGVPGELLSRAKRRDYAVLEALSGFFG